MRPGLCGQCGGLGHWEAECCNGAEGCSCRGLPVPMGRCFGCDGTGRPISGREQANAESIHQAGVAFLGSGPRAGYFAQAPALNRRGPDG